MQWALRKLSKGRRIIASSKQMNDVNWKVVISVKFTEMVSENASTTSACHLTWYITSQKQRYLADLQVSACYFIWIGNADWNGFREFVNLSFVASPDDNPLFIIISIHRPPKLIITEHCNFINQKKSDCSGFRKFPCHILVSLGLPIIIAIDRYNNW